ncbi:RTA1-domain-containing protein [Mollisia scopiformis]|uniref:RTA1-domain-containing protein n=1 Tax=Mollisia scopiformis TaxID=149040 RepID=A0A194XPC9_MOLSC|nr:RTA1-domain-containing protein [Mollisia scopiformis]KUJ21592.1 RTA1-domain-containing protein [Mollisia scopiformis]
MTICPLDTYEQAWFNYVPSLPGNALYEGIFALLLLTQLGLGFRYKTWGFSLGMVLGLILEVTGYIGRIELHYNPFKKSGFLVYLVPLTMGPAFLSAAIYLCLSRIVVLYGTRLSRFSPRTYTITFISCDIFSLVLQAIGGGMASTSNSQSSLHTGEHIMVAGLSFQVASLLLFIGLCTDFAFAVRRAGISNSANKIYNIFLFKAFLFALVIATIGIFIRSVFRVAELSKGFHGPLDNQEGTYMVLEGMMIIIASLSLTVFHPGLCFQGQWHAATFKVMGRKKDVGDKGAATGSTSEMDVMGKRAAVAEAEH